MCPPMLRDARRALQGAALAEQAVADQAVHEVHDDQVRRMVPAPEVGQQDRAALLAARAFQLRVQEVGVEAL
eukprot:8267431-Alexandrium_andersonii.AAC.1